MPNDCKHIGHITTFEDFPEGDENEEKETMALKETHTIQQLKKAILGMEEFKDRRDLKNISLDRGKHQALV